MCCCRPPGVPGANSALVQDAQRGGPGGTLLAAAGAQGAACACPCSLGVEGRACAPSTHAPYRLCVLPDPCCWSCSDWQTPATHSDSKLSGPLRRQTRSCCGATAPRTSRRWTAASTKRWTACRRWTSSSATARPPRPAWRPAASSRCCLPLCYMSANLPGAQELALLSCAFHFTLLFATLAMLYFSYIQASACAGCSESGGGRRAARVRGRAAAGAPRGVRAGHGVLPVQQRRGGRAGGGGGGREPRPGPRLGRPPRQRHPEHPGG